MSNKRHKKLNQEERFHISKRLQAGDNRNQIAIDLTRSSGTITRDINRNKDPITCLYSVLLKQINDLSDEEVCDKFIYTVHN